MGLVDDVVYNLKLIRKNLGFVFICVSVVSLGVALILPAYTFFGQLMYKPIPVPGGERYVAFVKLLSDNPADTQPFSTYDSYHFNYFRDNTTSFDILEAYRPKNTAISEGEIPASYIAVEVSSELLQAAGVRPLQGRLFTEEDYAPNAEPVAILGYSTWQSSFAGTPDIVGRQSWIDGELRTIVGVLAEGQKFPWHYELWLPLPTIPEETPGNGKEDLIIIGRLAEGVSRDEAVAEVQLLQEQIKSNWPDEYAHFYQTRVASYKGMVGTGLGPLVFLLALLGICIVGLMTFNISNLFLTRGEERLHELATRSALGATPYNIASALLPESLIICVLGLAVGIWVSSMALAGMNGFVQENSPGIAAAFFWDMSLSPILVITSIVFMAFIWALSGGVSAWQISRYDLSLYLNDSIKGMGSTGMTRLSKIMANMQFVMGCVILSVGMAFALMLPEVKWSGDIEIEDKYMATVDFSATGLESVVEQQNYLETLRQSLLNQPGISDVAFTTAVPGTSTPRVPYSMESEDLKFDDRYPLVYKVAVSNNFFDYLDIEILDGRALNVGDSETSDPVTVIDLTLANELWPNESPLGKRIVLNPEAVNETLTIVGVSRFISQSGVDGGGVPNSVVYTPMQQEFHPRISLVVSSPVEDFDFRGAIGAAALEVNRDIPIHSPESLVDLIQRAENGANVIRVIYLSLIVVSLYLTGLTSYGLAARAVIRRKVEIGIRMALGAGRGNAFFTLLKSGLAVVTFGLVIGIILSISLSYLLWTLIQASGVFVTMVPMVFAVCLTLGATIIVASFVPARRIVTMEPGDALRYE